MDCQLWVQPAQLVTSAWVSGSCDTLATKRLSGRITGGASQEAGLPFLNDPRGGGPASCDGKLAVC